MLDFVLNGDGTAREKGIIVFKQYQAEALNFFSGFSFSPIIQDRDIASM